MKIRILNTIVAASLMATLGACSSSSPDASTPTTTSNSPAKPAAGEHDSTKAGSEVVATADTTADKAKSVPAACDLLTEAEVSAAIGHDVVAEKEARYPQKCTWEFASTDSGTPQYLSLSTGAKIKFTVRTSRDSESSDTIEGVGDGAEFYLSGPSGWATENHVTGGKATLLVLVNNMSLEFNLNRRELERADSSKALAALAHKTIARL